MHAEYKEKKEKEKEGDDWNACQTFVYVGRDCASDLFDHRPRARSCGYLLSLSAALPRSSESYSFSPFLVFFPFSLCGMSNACCCSVPVPLHERLHIGLTAKEEHVSLSSSFLFVTKSNFTLFFLIFTGHFLFFFLLTASAVCSSRLHPTGKCHHPFLRANNFFFSLDGLIFFPPFFHSLSCSFYLSDIKFYLSESGLVR